MSNGLGRGLGSLIPQKPTKRAITTKEDSSIVPHKEGGVLMIRPEDVVANKMQPRKKFTDYKIDELAESIKKHGIIQPLVVSPKEEDKYELIAGERRLRASKIAGLEEVPVILRDVDEQKRLELALIENIQREELNPIDLALSYKRLMDEFNLTQEDVAKQVGKSRSSIANTLRMVNLPDEIQLALINGKISEGHAKYLLGIDGEVRQMKMFRNIVHNGLSVKDTETAIKKSGGTKQARVKINYRDNDKEFALREFFGTKARIVRKEGGGQIIIDFFSDEELSGMIDKIK